MSHSLTSYASDEGRSILTLYIDYRGDKMSIIVILSKIFVGLLTAYLVDSFALPFEGLYKLDIIHYNDFHARYEETSVETPTCRFNNGSCLGGFPRLYNEIMELRRQKPDSLLLNAGDSFQGTYWYTLLKWNITQEFMNLLPHDAHAVGNHEFDDGPEGLAPYFAALKAPVVAANMDVSKEPSLQGLFKRHVIVKRKGRKIGIIGLITTDTKTLSSPGNVVFTDPMEATDREVEILTEKGVDIIIILSHCGLDIDKQIANKHGKHVDIIVGGHSHSLLWNGPSPSGEDVAGPYPVFIETTDDKKHQVLIVQASAFTKYMGNLTVYFDYLGRYVKWDGGPVFLDRSIPEDPEIKKKLIPYAKLVHDAENVPIGKSLNDLRFQDCVFGECALGDLLVDALVDYAKANIKTDYNYLAFIQRGNIKSCIPNGEVTKGTIFDLLPFNDRIETFELQGNYLREALERSVSDAWDTNPFKGPWVLQVSGLNVTYNISMPEGQRIVKVTIGDGSELNDDAYYQVTAPAYLADGGDGFLMFKAGKRNVKVIGRDEKTIGNHDFDDGPLGLAPYLSSLKAPVVAANMKSNKEPLLQKLYDPYVILERGARKIGIIGLITPDTKTLSFTGNVEFTDPHEATIHEAQKLTKLGVDIIVLLSHCGYDVDVALAREHGQYVDVIVGGHSHRDESFVKPYLTIIKPDADKKKQVVVVQAFAFTKILGNLSVFFDVNGNVVEWEGAPITLDKSIPEDGAIKEKLAPYADLVHKAENMPVGEIKSTLDYRDCARGECKLGNLLTDALNHWTRQIIKSKYDCISFVQRSNINAILPQGQTFEMKGKHILKILERSVTDLSSLDPVEGPWILQVSE
ncbi:unnamed protein product, partial [Iphiclides podalirius]